MQILRANKLRILRIQNTKFSGYYFYMNANIQGDFQICISVPLIELSNLITITQWNYKVLVDCVNISKRSEAAKILI